MIGEGAQQWDARQGDRLQLLRRRLVHVEEVVPFNGKKLHAATGPCGPLGIVRQRLAVYLIPQTETRKWQAWCQWSNLGRLLEPGLHGPSDH